MRSCLCVFSLPLTRYDKNLIAVAIMYGRTEVVKFLLDEGVWGANKQDPLGLVSAD